ncbi:4,4'-diaponeurosporenoate glycosyltransferase, partial [Staphylococcus aureus]|nr:4,4'-diaponeurosporenoate glycosyltransferase [Staphylococcus aureus]MCD0880328.1 4,4'-diaponeurosporenoate glycosyltransferase [Staphylococcus aureus]MCD0911077.1 4,4'-diaponeurosporenoate glycosyltransferase [Staphylococcus aureus]
MKWLSRILTVIVTMSMACGALIFNRRHQLKTKTLNFNHKALTIIIPARNEEKRIGHLLHSIIQQQVPVDVIVMNDGSTDETARVARSYGATVVDVVDDTDGKWYGKSHACYQGVTHACTNRIAFVDADVTFLRKDAVETLINQYQLQGEKGLLSVQPYHITKRFYEGFSAIFNLMTVVGMNVFSTLDDGRTNQHAFGPVTLTNKEDYYATGGHKSANRHIIEGFALGSAYTSQSLPVTVYEGFPFVAFRMYQEGFQSLQEGWTKHLSTGAGGTKPKIMTAIVLWLFGSIASILGLCLSLKYRQMSVRKMVALYLSYTTQFIYLHRRVGQFSNLLMVCHPLLF